MVEFIQESSASESSTPSLGSEDDASNLTDTDEGPWWANMIPKASIPEAFGDSPFEGSKSARNAIADFIPNKQETLRKMALDCAKAGYIHKLNQMLLEHDPALLLLPSSNSQVGPQLTLLAAAQASGNPDMVSVVEEAATRLLFSHLRLLVDGWGEGSDAGNFVQRCLQAGADPSKPQDSQGTRPLQLLCQLSVAGFRLGATHMPRVLQQRVAQAAAQLAEAAPMVLILAFDHNGSTMIPLEAAAKNEDFGVELVPVLCGALGRLLLQTPALAAAPLLRKAVVEAQRCSEHPAVQQLASLVGKAAPCLDAATENSQKKSIWEPNCAYEDWFLRQRRLQILEPLVGQMDQADTECQRAEAQQKLAEVEALLEKQRRQHSAQIAELQMALDKAQRAAEEASARANEAVRSSQSKAMSTAGAFPSKGTDRAMSSLPGDTEGSTSPGELLHRIRQQRGLDIDYSGLPKSVEQSALAMQRSIGAAVERLAVDLYASRGHFLLELIQNADDNRYRTGDDPQLSLHLDSDQDGSLFFAAVNNELGMNSKDVEALCDINRSTKPAQEGKIGKKGVGWKAVFAVSDQPTVLSGSFRFSFDVRRRGRLGYVTPDELSLADYQALPHLLQEASANTVQPATVLYLPLRGGPPTEDGSACSAGDGGVAAAALIRSSMERLLRCPTWLLFLRQLRRVAWQDIKNSSRPLNVVVERRDHSLYKRSWSGEAGSADIEEIAYFLHRKTAVVPKDVLPLGVAEGSRKEEVIVAFRKSAVAKPGDNTFATETDADPVFCFLPVRPVGFRFSLHAPWALTSNREDFHVEDPKNVWLRDVCAMALAEAMGRFGEHGGNVLTLLDGRRVLEPFWRRLLEQAVNYLGDAPVVPVLGENQLYRPSEVLVPPQALVRCSGAMKFLHRLPASLWPVATGKRLARVGGEGISEEVAEEDSRRLLSLNAEALTSRRIKSLLNCGPVGEEFRRSCRSKGSILIHLLELLNVLLTAASQPGNTSEGSERLAMVVAEIQQMKVIPVDLGEGQEPMMSSLAEGDVFLPGQGKGHGLTWCPGLPEDITTSLLVHKGIRVFDSLAWKALPMSSQGLLKQLGIREATLAEAAASVVRVHALQLDEALQVPHFSGTFVKLGSCIGGEEAEVKVLWAGLEVVCLAHEACRDDTGKPVLADASLKPDPSLCGAPIVGRGKSPLQMTAEAFGQVLWLPARSADGELCLRRAPALLRPTFLGVPAEMTRQKEFAPESLSSRSETLMVEVSDATLGTQGIERRLRWEVFLSDLKSVQPPFETLDLQVVAERLVSRHFWEVLAKSADLRRHVCRVFRENESWLSDLEVPTTLGPGPRLGSYFRRGAFEPIVGEAGLPYVDAPETCQPLLEMLRIRCVANFENLAVALSCWAEKEPPPMCAPKALMHALQRQAVHERQAPSVLLDLKKKIFIPGKGPIEAHQAVWSAGGDNDFVRSICKLADAPVLEDIYGESLRGWFCDFLNVRETPGVFQLLQALTRILPVQIGGGQEGPKVKPTLLLLRQIYAELFLQLQGGFRASEDVQRLKCHVDLEPSDPLTNYVKSIFQSKRFVVLPQARGRPWKFLTSAGAYWSVDFELADLPCSKFALSNFYASPVKSPCRSGSESVDVDLKHFFVEVLGIKEVLTREELARRFTPQTRPPVPPQASQARQQDRHEDSLSEISSSEESEDAMEDDATLGLEDLLGDEAGLLDILPAFGNRSRGGSDAKRRRTENAPVDADVDAAFLRNLMSRCTQRTRSAQAGEAMYTGGSTGHQTTVEEVALRKVHWSHKGLSLYACGPPVFLASPEALEAEGLSLAGRQASVPRGSLLPSAGLQQKAAAFADAVLIPLAEFFQVPAGSLASAVGPSIGRGRNVHGLICFNLPRQEIRRSDLCRWYCEMCRLLAANTSGEDFTTAEVASALTAQHMTRFLQFQASVRRRR